MTPLICLIICSLYLIACSLFLPLFHKATSPANRDLHLSLLWEDVVDYDMQGRLIWSNCTGIFIPHKVTSYPVKKLSHRSPPRSQCQSISLCFSAICLTNKLSLASCLTVRLAFPSIHLYFEGIFNQFPPGARQLHSLNQILSETIYVQQIHPALNCESCERKPMSNAWGLGVTRHCWEIMDGHSCSNEIAFEACPKVWTVDICACVLLFNAALLSAIKECSDQ